MKAKTKRKDSKQQPFHHVHVAYVSQVGSEKVTPFCEHGPCLLFERCKKGELERYYVCSVCRSRKDCSIYYRYDAEPYSEEKIDRALKQMKLKRGATHSQLYKQLKIFRKLPSEDRLFCITCSTLLLDKEAAQKHQKLNGNNHQIEKGIGIKQLRHPTTLLEPKNNNKLEAQYFFNRSTVKFLVNDVIDKLGFDGVLNVGTPRLHETLIRPPMKGKCRSFLLDYDYRYAQFFSPRQYAQFNMFNGYFYTKLGDKCYQRFLRQDIKKLLIVIDPPFGGMIEPLAEVLRSLQDDFRGNSYIMWFFPYFMESKLNQLVPELKMLDYKVSYDEHPLMKQEKTERDSPIRIFTNIKQRDVVLPTKLGYRFCDKCERYVAAENTHCDACGSCASKDGRTYRHCQQCGRCVKPTYKHCAECGRCHAAVPKCVVQKPSCGLCSESGHVWTDCPSRTAGLAKSDDEEQQTTSGAAANGRKPSDVAQRKTPTRTEARRKSPAEKRTMKVVTESAGPKKRRTF